MEFIVPEPFYDQKPFLIIGRKIVSEMEKSKNSRFGSPYMIFQHKLVQSTQKNCASPAVTVPMAKSAIFGPKREILIFPKFSKFWKIWPSAAAFQTLFGRRHGAVAVKFDRQNAQLANSAWEA